MIGSGAGPDVTPKNLTSRHLQPHGAMPQCRICLPPSPRSHHWYCQHFCFRMSLSPSESAMPCVFERIRINPTSLPPPSSCLSTDTLTSASSPKTLLHIPHHHAFRAVHKEACVLLLKSPPHCKVQWTSSLKSVLGIVMTVFAIGLSQNPRL